MNKFIYHFVCFVIFAGCDLQVIHANTTKMPFKAFVKINANVTFDTCVKTNEQSFCQNNRFSSSGSGFIVKKQKNKTYIMTAAHVCIPEIKADSISITNIKTIFNIQTMKNKIYTAKVYRVPSEYISKVKPIDLCLLVVKRKLNYPTIKIATKEPVMGEKIYNIAAPTGFFFPPSVVFLEGFYSGQMTENHSLITVPGMGGSSGSPVLNKSGRLIGLLFAANPTFPHISISMNYSSVSKFLKQNLR